uniref:Uncharacterized protein n=1 Tax=Panagrolaimus superbus TaxID=310955 RepID=A0A914YXE3_9BILA
MYEKLNKLRNDYYIILILDKLSKDAKLRQQRSEEGSAFISPAIFRRSSVSRPLQKESSSSVSDEVIFVQQITTSNSPKVSPAGSSQAHVSSAAARSSYSTSKPSSSTNNDVSCQTNGRQKSKEKHQQQAASISTSEFQAPMQQTSHSPMEVEIIDISESEALPAQQNGLSLRRSSLQQDTISEPKKKRQNPSASQPTRIEIDHLKSSKESTVKKSSKASLPRNRGFNNILKMSNEFESLLVNRDRGNRIFHGKTLKLPPKWNPKALLPEVEAVDDGYDSSDNIPLPSGKGPCGITSTQQNIALDIHCINRTLRSIDPDQKYKILKSFLDEKTQCTIFFYLHAKEFGSGNESMLARVALQRFVMLLNNALKLYELSTIPDTFYGKKIADPQKEWHIPVENCYSYDAPEYVEFERAGASRKIATFYTEFTKVETNILLDAHLLLQHSKDLSSEKRSKYIKDHTELIFQWLKHIKLRANNKEHIHHNFIVWCDLSLPLKNAYDVLLLMEIIFKPQMTSMSESLQNEFGAEKFSPSQHKRYYQAALKGLNCNDFGLDKFHCRDENLWYTAFVGSFFNDVCDINDDQDELYQPFIAAFRQSIDTTKDMLQEKYGNFQHLFADKKFWDKIIEKKCQKIPRPFDLYKNLATFFLEASQHDPNCFDYTAHLIRPFNPDLKVHMETLAALVKMDAMNKKETHNFIQTIVDDIMAHFYPILRTFNELSTEHSAAVRLFTIYVLKGFLMEWEEYNKWTKEMREGKKYDREGSGLDLELIKEYFGKDFMNLPANIMTAIWERKFHVRFFSSNVPKELRKLLTCPEFKILSAETITKILDFYENIGESNIEVKWFKKNDQESEVELMDSTEEFDESLLEAEKNASMSSFNNSFSMNGDNDVVNGTGSSSDNIDNCRSVQVQSNLPQQPHPITSKFGLQPPRKFRSGRLSQWAFKNAVADFEEKGDGFLMAPINQAQDKNSKKRPKRKSSNNYALKVSFKHPVLKSLEEKFYKDFIELNPEMQSWALHFTSVLEDIISDKSENNSTDAGAKNNSNAKTTVKSLSSTKRVKILSTDTSINSNLHLLSPYPLIAVCCRTNSVIYRFPNECLKTPVSENILERHQLNKSCKIWDYLRGKPTKLNHEIIAFLCDIWKKTVIYSQKCKKAENNKDFIPALTIIRNIQEKKETVSDTLIDKIVGVRFPFDLREQKYLKDFCTMYIDVEALSYKDFKFHFDIKM